MENNNKKAVILYDGFCKLCNGSVRFISNRDHRNIFTYLSLQSDKANKILDNFENDIKDIDSVLLVMDGKVMANSTAALTIARYLSGFWPMLYGLIIIPKFMRDFVYNLIAKKRHKWFGRIDHKNLNINNKK